MRPTFMVTVGIPILIILLAIPLTLQKVPRNGFYGFRTLYTMSSNEIWYYSNKLAGIALLLSGLFWLALGRILPAMMRSDRAVRLASLLGTASLVAGCVISYVLTRRHFRG